MNKILVIQNKRIGDVLIASLIAVNLKKVFPKALIDYMVYDYTAGVIEENPYINSVIKINEKKLKNISNLIRTALQIRKSKYDLIVDPYSKFQSRVICLLSGTAVRIGYQKKAKKPVIPFYTHAVKFLKESSQPCGKSIADRVNLVTSVFKIEQPEFVPKIYLSASEKQYNQLKKCNKLVLMLGILGSTPQKSMPQEHIVAIINYITVNYEVFVLFNYAPHQKKEAAAIYNLCNNKSQIIYDIYEDNIRGFILLMNQCKLLVANEGGTVHIAKALNKPTFTIYSPYVLKDHWASFEDGKTHTSVHLLDVYPNLYSKDRKERKKIEENPVSMYKKLSPEILIPKLKVFLDYHLI